MKKMVNFKEINFEGKDMLTVYLNGGEVLSTIRIENLKNPDDDKNLIFNLGISIVNIKKTDVKSLYIKIKDPFHFIFESLNFISNLKSEDLFFIPTILTTLSILQR